MEPYDKAKEKYLTNPEFHTLVDLYYYQLLQNQFTIQEMKEALVFAGIKFESERVDPMPMPMPSFNYSTLKKGE